MADDSVRPQKAVHIRKSTANPQAFSYAFVGADAHIGP